MSFGSNALLSEKEYEAVSRYGAKPKKSATIEAYTSSVRKFMRWLGLREGDNLPAPFATLRAYAAHQADHKLRTNSIGREISGLKDFYDKSGYDVSGVVVCEIMKGVRGRAGADACPKEPLTRKNIICMLKASDQTSRSIVGGIRNKALYAMAWAGALQAHEVRELQFEDVEKVSDGYRILIGNQEAVTISERTFVSAIRGWVTSRGRSPGPFFLHINRGGRIISRGLSDDGYRRAIKKGVAAIGLDPSKYSGESMRSGHSPRRSPYRGV